MNRSPVSHSAEGIEIDGIRGTDGSPNEAKNVVAAEREAAGSIQAIRGIEGIDAVMLENLEIVLRMQERPRENEGMGGVSTAASLLSSEPPEDFEEIPDERDIHVEWKLEGS